jgi:hypothetical protein
MVAKVVWGWALTMAAALAGGNVDFGWHMTLSSGWMYFVVAV